jgi:competence protein ComFC
MSKYPPHYFLILRFLSRYVFTTKYKILYDFLPSSRSRVLLTEVPISGLKMFERGFNQSKIITQELSRITEIADFSLLKRTKDTKPLFEMSFGERQRELRNCMKSNINSKIFRLFGYKNIVIVDDVYTSGSTLNESASALRKEGFSSIYYLTLFTI